ncbi:hypothetical protein RJ641_015493 [Dillenia turbinata]|uniref:C3H1-type domain-containing protein n=1 Tax=Dillenia turbinata TaxID=194707 RepID=A0AAN8YY91_9MAGN
MDWSTLDETAQMEMAHTLAKPQQVENCENLFWLRGSGKFSLHGLSVVYLSGKQPPGPLFGTYSQDNVDALRASMGEPGIIEFELFFIMGSHALSTGSHALISNSINCYSLMNGHLGLQMVPHETGADSTISELVAEMKPRHLLMSYHALPKSNFYFSDRILSSMISYHIAGTKDIYYAREPYSNVDAVPVIRFLGLASVENRDRQKFIHALSPTRASSMTTAEICLKPPNSTSSSSPYNVHVHGEKCHFRQDVDTIDQFSRGVCFDFINEGKCERGPDCSYKHSLQDEGQSMSTKRSQSDSTSFEMLDSLTIVCCIHAPSVVGGLLVLFVEPKCRIASEKITTAIPVPLSKASAAQNIFNLAAKKLGFSFTTTKNKKSSEGRKLLKSQFDKEHSCFYVELLDCTMLSQCMEENENFPVQFGQEVPDELANHVMLQNIKRTKIERHSTADRVAYLFMCWDKGISVGNKLYDVPVPSDLLKEPILSLEIATSKWHDFGRYFVGIDPTNQGLFIWGFSLYPPLEQSKISSG